MALLFGAGQMAHHVAEIDAVQPSGIIRDRVEFTLRQSQPRHAGIDLNDRRKLAAKPARQRRPGIDLLQAVEDGDHAMLDEVGFDSGRRTVQHEDLGLCGNMGPQRYRFVQMSREEVRAAVGSQGRSHAIRAKPVSVGLDHGGAGRPAELFAQQPVIGADRIEIDGQQRSGAGVAGIQHGPLPSSLSVYYSNRHASSAHPCRHCLATIFLVVILYAEVYRRLG